MKRLLIALGCLTVPVSLLPFPGLSAQKRAITIDDYLALKSVGNPQLSPDGKWVARSEEHTSELQSRLHLVCRLLLEKNRQIYSASNSDVIRIARACLCRIHEHSRRKTYNVMPCVIEVYLDGTHSFPLNAHTHPHLHS